LQGELSRQAKRERQAKLTEADLPHLWILTPTLSVEKLADFGAIKDVETWGEGIYLFFNLKIILDIKQSKNTDEAELMVKLSPWYLEQIDIATQKGQAAGEAAGLVPGRLAEGQSLIIRQLTRKLGEINPETIESIHQLTLEQLESLGDALLDFNAIEDLH
jgi:Domain of unknown function (DUF4351)